MSNRDVKKYMSVLRSSIKTSIKMLKTVSPDTELFRTLCININNSDMTIRQYKDLLEFSKIDSDK